MGSTDISLGSQGRSGRSGKVFKKGEGCCGIRQGTMLLSKRILYNGIYTSDGVGSTSLHYVYTYPEDPRDISVDPII